jgi:hypothetical protein
VIFLINNSEICVNIENEGDETPCAYNIITSLVKTGKFIENKIGKQRVEY